MYIYVYIYQSKAKVRQLGQPASVAHLDALSVGRPGGCGFNRFNPRRDLQHSFMEIDHEIQGPSQYRNL